VRSGAVTGGPRGGASVRPGVRLLWEADALLALVPQLRATGFVSNLPRLREQIAGLLRDFQARAVSNGFDAGRIAQASEVLAALIDQVATSMPWGADLGWRSLAAAAPGGAGRAPASPAARLSELTRASSSDAGMRELIGIALALGFGGRISGADGAQIDQVRAQLAAADPKAQLPAGLVLSGGSAAVERGHALISWLPLWVTSLAVAAALAVLFFALELSLAAKSDRLYARILALKAPAATASAPLPASRPRLAGLLSGEAAQSNLTVRDEIDRSVIVVPGKVLFEAGRATLEPSGAELLRKLAPALQGIPGRIQVIGHTEGTVAHSARYPSDWELSVDRARAVEEALHGASLDAARLRYDGRASTEPVGGAGTAPAVNGDGRIEIVLLVGR
jgi:type VI secretion system protein ImpK